MSSPDRAAHPPPPSPAPRIHGDLPHGELRALGLAVRRILRLLIPGARHVVA